MKMFPYIRTVWLARKISQVKLPVTMKRLPQKRTV
jgi:hypothetical protein